MAVVELEIRELQFSILLGIIVTSAPIRVPTLAVLGADRLIDELVWDPVMVGPTPPNFAPPPGTLAARASVTVKHVSIAELDANPNAARTETTLIASLLVTASAGQLTVWAVQFDIGAVTPHILSLPLMIGRQDLPVESDFNPVAGALVIRDHIVTLRLATSSDDDLTSSAMNRLGDGGTWLVRVSGELFAARVRQDLAAAVTPPPGGTVIEDDAAAAWAAPGGTWQVVGSVGLKKQDACPTLFGDVDLSVTINAFLGILPRQPTDKQLTLRLRIESDASDWDVARCWAGSAGLISLVAAVVVNPLVGALAAGLSLVGLGEAVRLLVGSKATSFGPHGFTEIARDDSSVTFQSTMPLPSFGASDPDDNSNLGVISDVAVGADGLIVVGDFRKTLSPARHNPQFLPNGGVLTGAWASGFSCSKGSWDNTYVVPPIVVKDTTFIVTEFLANRLVTVFPTTQAVPGTQWEVAIPRPAFDPQITVAPLVDPSPRQTGRVFLHTSAGIRRYDLAPVPVPRGPTLQEIVEGRLNCLITFLPPMIEVNWLPDPPFFDLGLPPLQQWLVVISEVRAGSRLSVHTVRDGVDVAEPIVSDVLRSGPASFEVITDAGATLQIRHNSEMPDARCRVEQRWLLPVRVLDLRGAVTAMVRSGDTLTVRTARGSHVSTFRRAKSGVATGFAKRKLAIVQRRLVPRSACGSATEASLPPGEVR
jgi:hypothetical protein